MAEKTVVKKKATKRVSKKASKKVPEKPSRKKTGRKPRAGQELHPMRVRGTLFHKMKAYAAELSEAATRVKMLALQVQIEAQKPEHAPLVLLMQSRDEAQQHAARVRDNFIAVQTEVASRFGIPLDEAPNYSFDTESGVLMPPGPPPKNL